MNSIFEPQRNRVHLQRNAFDLSHSDVFSVAPGMLLPIHVSEVNPNEHFEISPSMYIRTMPLNTAAYTRVKQHIEFYFVPMRVLCRQFNQFIVGTDYKISSIDSLNQYQTLGAYFDSVRFIQSLDQEDENTYPNIFGLNGCNDTVRLLDMLGYGINSVTLDNFNGFNTDNVNFKRLNLFRLLAYQKIYFDFYRNTNYEVNNPSAYNIDKYFGTNKVFQSITEDDAKEIFRLRYRNWNKDYFTCATPQWLGTDYVTLVPEVPLPLAGYDETERGYFAPVNDSSGVAYDVQSSVGAQLFADNSGQSGYVLQLANLRAAFALDKLLRLSINAKDGDYGSQIKSHYGIDAVHDDWKATFIGGCTSAVTINEVITTATTEQAPTGDIYGKGASLNSGRFTFDSKEHGIIMGILSIVPDADYQSSMLDRFNMKQTREEYFQPEFADLGKQALTAHELKFGIPDSTNTKHMQQDRVLGFVPRYSEYKTSVDKVHGQFVNKGSLSAWSAPRNNPTIDVDSVGRFTSTSLKVDPRILNPIMSVAYDGTEKTDQFICDSSVQVHAIRPMSVHGEPML